MELRIEPSTYDVIVASTGLVECLVASALVRAGKSVLVLDQADVYGHDHASYTPAALLGSQDPRVNPHASLVLPKHSPRLPELPTGLRFSPYLQDTQSLTLGGLPLHGVTHWLAAGGQSIEQDSRSTYILDLAPKVLYQAEQLVDTLVSTRSHNYLEFKAVCSSFIYREGKLQAIPASRAEIFKDKGLSLADKRVLMQFLSRCMEAKAGQGPLMEYLSSSQLMTELLTSQGVTGALQDVVLYGICMAHTQQPAALPAAAQPSSAQANGAQQVQGQQCSGGDVGAVQGSGLTAADGLAALILYAESTGRFGTTGALMVPRYGSGSLAEALVRHCAVKGAVTALRVGLAGVMLGPRSVALPQQDPPGDSGSKQANTLPPSSTDAQVVVPADVSGDCQADDSTDGTPAVVGLGGQADASSSSDATALPEPSTVVPGGSAQDEDDGVEVVRGIVLDSGQVLECTGKLLLGARLTSCLLPAHTTTSTTSSSTQDSLPTAQTTAKLASAADAGSAVVPEAAAVARGVVLLNGPLQPECSLCTLVVPAGYVQGGSPHPVYGLQLSPDTAVVPRNRCLLYLSTAMSPAESQTAQQLLEPALCALAHLQPAGSDEGPVKPVVLEAFYYTQPSQTSASSHTAASEGSTALPANVVVCPGPRPTLHGYQQEVAAAQQLLTSHFPGVRWLLDEDPEGAEEQGSEGGGGEEQEDADIDELAAALKSLADLQPVNSNQ